MNSSEIAHLARQLMNEHGLTHWVVNLDRAEVRAGQCRFTTRTLGFSPKVMNQFPPERVKNTVLHEIAHALVGPGHGHDATWKAMAKKIGCDANRTYNSTGVSINYKYTVVCDAGHVCGNYVRQSKSVTTKKRCALCWRGSRTISYLRFVNYTAEKIGTVSEIYGPRENVVERILTKALTPSRPVRREIPKPGGQGTPKQKTCLRHYVVLTPSGVCPLCD